MTKCKVKSCPRVDIEARGFCGAHYQRWRHHLPLNVRIRQPAPPSGKCTIMGCNALHSARGLCSSHYNRWNRYGDPMKPPKRAKKGHARYGAPGGYIWIFAKGHPGANKNNCIFEHRIIMEKMLGRLLHKDERVHHKNGIRNDNRPKNLELWVVSHPAGQRVEDQLKWAKEILKRYG